MCSDKQWGGEARRWAAGERSSVLCNNFSFWESPLCKIVLGAQQSAEGWQGHLGRAPYCGLKGNSHAKGTWQQRHTSIQRELLLGRQGTHFVTPSLRSKDNCPLLCCIYILKVYAGDLGSRARDATWHLFPLPTQRIGCHCPRKAVLGGVEASWRKRGDRLVMPAVGRIHEAHSPGGLPESWSCPHIRAGEGEGRRSHLRGVLRVYLI